MTVPMSPRCRYVYASDDKELTYTNFRPGYPIRWDQNTCLDLLLVRDLLQFRGLEFWGPLCPWKYPKASDMHETRQLGFINIQTPDARGTTRLLHFGCIT